MRATGYRRSAFDGARTEHCRVAPPESYCEADHELREGRTRVSARRSRADVWKLAQPPDGPLVPRPRRRDREWNKARAIDVDHAVEKVRVLSHLLVERHLCGNSRGTGVARCAGTRRSEGVHSRNVEKSATVAEVKRDVAGESAKIVVVEPDIFVTWKARESAFSAQVATTAASTCGDGAWLMAVIFSFLFISYL